MHLFLRESFNSNRENAKKDIKTHSLRHINFDLIAFNEKIPSEMEEGTHITP